MLVFGIIYECENFLFSFVLFNIIGYKCMILNYVLLFFLDFEMYIKIMNCIFGYIFI